MSVHRLDLSESYQIAARLHICPVHHAVATLGEEALLAWVSGAFEDGACTHISKFVRIDETTFEIEVVVKVQNIKDEDRQILVNSNDDKLNAAYIKQCFAESAELEVLSARLMLQ